MFLAQTTTRCLARGVTSSFSRGVNKGNCRSRCLSTTTSSGLKDSYDNILVDFPATDDACGTKKVALITLNRPKALNALNDALFEDLLHATQVLDADRHVRCMVLTGSNKAFAAGADISEMKDRTYEECASVDMFREWQQISRLQTPLIAAVSGFCLGGGCELAMMCDMMVCSESAKVRPKRVCVCVKERQSGCVCFGRLCSFTTVVVVVDSLDNRKSTWVSFRVLEERRD
jgi:hypothetical protein